MSATTYEVSEEVARDDELLEAAREAVVHAKSPRAKAAAELLVATMEEARAKYVARHEDKARAAAQNVLDIANRHIAKAGN